MKALDDLVGVSPREDIPKFRSGDSVIVGVRIIEGGKEKLQDFKGLVIARKGTGMNETFIVRKISYGEGVERTFYINSPRIKSITLTRKGKVRRSRLYYIRQKVGKKAKVKELQKKVIITKAQTVPVENVEESKESKESK